MSNKEHALNEKLLACTVRVKDVARGDKPTENDHCWFPAALRGVVT